MGAFGRQNSARFDPLVLHPFSGLQNTAMCGFLLGDFWRVSKPYPEPVLGGDGAIKET
jgi:hypothetical protein